MAHIEKYRAEALGGMLGHYERWGGDVDKLAGRDNIDPSMMLLNYNLGPERDGTQREFIDERIASLKLKRKPRKDAVRMCDCVLTMPRSLDPSRRDDFFRSAYGFLSKRYGCENVVSAWVHLDEPDAQPHMHFAWVPVTSDGRLSAKEVCSRTDWKTLHQDMRQHLEDELGCNVEVLLDEEKQGEKQLSHLSQREYRAAKKALRATQRQLEKETRRLESVRQEREAAERRVDVLERAAAAVADAERDAGGRGGDALSSFVARCRELVGEVVSGFTASMRSAWESLTVSDGPRLTLRRRAATAYHGAMPEALGRDEGQGAREVEQVAKTKELGCTLGK